MTNPLSEPGGKALYDEFRTHFNPHLGLVEWHELNDEMRGAWNATAAKYTVAGTQIAAIRELCQANQCEAVGGGMTDANAVWPSEILAIINGSGS